MRRSPWMADNLGDGDAVDFAGDQDVVEEVHHLRRQLCLNPPGRKLSDDQWREARQMTSGNA